MRFVDEHAGRRSVDGLVWGVEPICRVLTDQGSPIAPSTYYEARGRRPSKRALREEALKTAISVVHVGNYGVYGARKVWLTLNRQGVPVARCTVERLMRQLGLAGARRGKVKRTTIADARAAQPADLVKRRFAPLAPDRLWVVDMTYVSTWSGWAYVAFCTDAYARRILGWAVASSMSTDLPLVAIDQAIWTRRRAGADLTGVIHHADHGSQYGSLRYGEHLAAAGITPSVGAVGSSYDNTLAETINGLFKTEVIRRRGPWHTLEQVELATATWVDWYNHQRLYEYCGDMPPTELEDLYYRHTRTQATA